jgi:hypothetical protein
MEHVERLDDTNSDADPNCQETDNLAERLSSSKSYLLALSVFGAANGLIGHELLQAGPGQFGALARIALFLSLQVPLLTFAVVDQLRRGREWPMWKSVTVPVLGALIAAAITLVLA